MVRNKINLVLVVLLITIIMGGCSCSSGESKSNSVENSNTLVSESDATSNNISDLIEPKEWSHAYINFINTEKRNPDNITYTNMYALVFINNDNIPELLISGDSFAGGIAVCTYLNGNVNIQSYAGGDCEYIPGKGLVHFFNIRRWIDSHMICEIKDGQFITLAQGGSELNEATKTFDNYTLNDIPTTKVECAKGLALAFDNSAVAESINDVSEHISFYNSKSNKNLNSEHYYSYDDIIKVLEST